MTKNKDMRARVFFLGTGASADFAELPTMSNFFREEDFKKSTKWSELALFIKGNESIFRNDNNNGTDKNSDCLNINLEKVVNYISIFSNLPAEAYLSSGNWSNDVRYSSDEDKKVKKINDFINETGITFSYLLGKKHFIDNVRDQLNDYINTRLSINAKEIHFEKVDKFLEYVKPGDSIITTNYDILIDQRLQKAEASENNKEMWNRSNDILGEPLTYSGTTPVASLKDELTKGVYLKLHGSLNWLVCLNGRCPSHFAIINNIHHKYCRRCGSILQPVIVPPTFYKSIDEYPRLGYIWDIAFTKMAQAGEIVFYGFSFPESDLPISWLIREAYYATHDWVDIQVGQQKRFFDQDAFKSNGSASKVSKKPKDIKDFSIPQISIINLDPDIREKIHYLFPANIGIKQYKDWETYCNCKKTND